jgi:hypothetical protein
MQERQRQKVASTTLQLLSIISLSLIFGIQGFLYSFFGLFEQTRNIIMLEPFHALTIQETGGHFLFGFIVGIAVRSVKVAILTGLMALAIDSDHLLNIVGFHIQDRIDHSILFAILSSILMSLIATKIPYVRLSMHALLSAKVSGNNEKAVYRRGTKNKNRNNNIIHNEANLFVQLLFMITFGAFLSHIAYDVFVDDKASFPLLAPFSFSQNLIPRMYSLPIEAAGFIAIYLWYTHYYHNNRVSTQSKDQNLATTGDK